MLVLAMVYARRDMAERNRASNAAKLLAGYAQNVALFVALSNSLPSSNEDLVRFVFGSELALKRSGYEVVDPTNQEFILRRELDSNQALEARYSLTSTGLLRHSVRNVRVDR